jgi:stage V sporulation protein B
MVCGEGSSLKRIVFNTALLTAAAIIMRVIAMVFQIWLAGRIGSAGIGLFQLVISVGILAVTVAVSGIRFATARLISEEQGLGRPGGVGRAMRRCLLYGLFFGSAAALMLFFCAEPIGFLWVRDARTVFSLQLFSLSLPFVALSSVLAGYFTAVGRVYKTAASQLFEQLLRIALVMAILGRVPAGDLESSCAAVVAGGVAADIVCFLLLFMLFAGDRRRHGLPGTSSPRLTPRMLGIALPLAVSAYARVALTTFEQLLVPRGLRASGLSANMALSGYGIIQGMVFPVVTFPACVLFALAELLVPELTEAQVAGRTEKIRSSVSSLLKKSLLYSLTSALVLYLSADALGHMIYHSAEAGRYIRIFAPAVPLVYMDIVTDGCLKGLGQMMWSMTFNITEAVIGVLLVWFLLPVYGLAGYVVILYICEIFNFILSVSRLYQVAFGKGCKQKNGNRLTDGMHGVKMNQ